MSESIIRLVKETWSKNLVFMGFLIVLMVWFPNRISLIAGFLVGAFISMLNFLIIAWNSEYVMDREDSLAVSFGAFYVLRMVFAGLVIFLGIRLEGLNLLTLMIGLFSVRVAMTLGAFLEFILEKRRVKLKK